MKIYTSSFGRASKIPEDKVCLAISRDVPNWWVGQTYDKLVPSKAMMDGLKLKYF